MDQKFLELADLIRQTAQEEINKRDITVPCIVRNVNNDYTVDVCLLSDEEHIIKNIKCTLPIQLNRGDNVLVYKVGNKFNNAFVISVIGNIANAMLISQENPIAIAGAVTIVNGGGNTQTPNNNVIEKILMPNGRELPVNNKGVQLPLALSDQAGLVKSSNNDNKIKVETDGTMTVNNISTDKLFQGNVKIILDGGKATMVDE